MNELNNDSNPSAQTYNASRRRMNRSKRLFVITALVGTLVIGIGIGFSFAEWAGDYPISFEEAQRRITADRSIVKSTTVDFGQFWDVWDSIQQRHVNQPVDEERLLYGAITGLVAGIDDPYSVYFDPTVAPQFLDEIQGSFSGVGIEVAIKNEVLTVVAPVPDSPAARAGVLAGDTILAIDGIDTVYLSLNTAVDAIRGDEGSTVVLTLKRQGTDQPFDVALLREVIRIESLRWAIIEQNGKRIAQITLTHFNADTGLKFQEAVNEILLTSPDALILDVRNNPGGFFDVSIAIASQFLKEGTVVVVEQKGSGEEKAYSSQGPGSLASIPTVVLINKGSASASEIVVGALRDHQQAFILGETTFGKGTVQDVETFEDGSTLKLTVARWLTPNKQLIDTVGITPDVTVERTADDFSNNRDPQLDAALLYVTDRTAFDVQFQPTSE